MSQREFTRLLDSLNALSPEQMATLRRELDSRIAAGPKAKGKHTPPAADKTAFDVLERAGLIGCLKGKASSPTDLATNSKHMEGFGGG
jgi:hypothetical protein